MGAPFQLFFDQILPRSGIFAQILPRSGIFGSKFSVLAQILAFRGICCFETLHLVVNLPLSSLRNFKNFQATHQLTLRWSIFGESFPLCPKDSFWRANKRLPFFRPPTGEYKSCRSRKMLQKRVFTNFTCKILPRYSRERAL